MHVVSRPSRRSPRSTPCGNSAIGVRSVSCVGVTADFSQPEQRQPSPTTTSSDEQDDVDRIVPDDPHAPGRRQSDARDDPPGPASAFARRSPATRADRRQLVVTWVGTEVVNCRSMLR